MQDNQLRSDRLVFYEQDLERLLAELDAFLELSKSRCALLIDRDGHLVTQRGEPTATSFEAISRSPQRAMRMPKATMEMTLRAPRSSCFERDTDASASSISRMIARLR